MLRSIAFLRHAIVAPTLAEIADAARMPHFAAPAAIDLVMGTAAAESEFAAIHQVGGGPALGFWQIEPATARDVRDNYLRYRPALDDAVKRALHDLGPWERQLATSLTLGAIMCRLIYLRWPGPLPRHGDVPGYAAYWKAHYNTRLGAGTEQKFRETWSRLIAPTLKPEV